MGERSRYDLTDGQRRDLRILLRAGAVDLETSVNVFFMAGRGLNPNVLSILQVNGFTDSKVRVARGGSRCTHYWLTAAGLAMAKSLAEGADA